jgi:hypothetical protein
MGQDVTVYCRTYFSPAQPAYNGMRLIRLPTICSKHLETLVRTFLSTVHALFSDCDIVHYYCLGPALFSFLPRWFGKKTVVTVQGLDWQRRKWGRVAAILRVGEQVSVKTAGLDHGGVADATGLLPLAICDRNGILGRRKDKQQLAISNLHLAKCQSPIAAGRFVAAPRTINLEATSILNF